MFPCKCSQGCQLLGGRPWFPPSQHFPVFLCVPPTSGPLASGLEEGQADRPRLLARLSRGRGNVSADGTGGHSWCVSWLAASPGVCKGLWNPFLSSQALRRILSLTGEMELVSAGEMEMGGQALSACVALLCLRGEEGVEEADWADSCAGIFWEPGWRP